MAVVAGNRGFLAIDDWIKANLEGLIDWFNLHKERLPAYSTLRPRALRWQAKGRWGLTYLTESPLLYPTG